MREKSTEEDIMALRNYLIVRADFFVAQKEVGSEAVDLVVAGARRQSCSQTAQT